MIYEIIVYDLLNHPALFIISVRDRPTLCTVTSNDTLQILITMGCFFLLYLLFVAVRKQFSACVSMPVRVCR